jgi:predicted DNA-binding transcriptional regulator AlpA
MVQSNPDLISMADIARLAGQSRATVGNWKSRNPDDFPIERARGPRGPLYDRSEVIAWLEATNRLGEHSPDALATWHLADQVRAGMPTDDAIPLTLLLLALMASSPSEWETIRSAPVEDLDQTVRTRAHALFPFADELLPRGELPGQALAQAVSVTSTFDRSRLSSLADALLHQGAEMIGRRGGEYFTPASVRKLVVALAEPTGVLYNPATGIGQLVVDAAEHQGSPTAIYGQEINRRSWAMAQLNLAIHRVDAEIALGDVFTADGFPDLRADRVIAVPPWMQKLTAADRLMGDPRWVYGEPRPNDGNAAWIQHCLHHLADDGRAVLVMPNGALFEGGRAGRIRQRLVKAGLLDAVFALPPGLFPWTSLACSVLIFAKGRPTADGKPASVLMVDAGAADTPRPRRSADLSDAIIDELVSLYRDWTAGRELLSSSAAIADFDELALNDFVIDPGRYLSLPQPELDLDETIRQRSVLLAALDRLTRASREADGELAAILGEGSS